MHQETIATRTLIQLQKHRPPKVMWLHVDEFLLNCGTNSFGPMPGIGDPDFKALPGVHILHQSVSEQSQLKRHLQMAALTNDQPPPNFPGPSPALIRFMRLIN